MDVHTIRQQLKTKPIYEIPLRVTFYARVSSESDEQLNSLGNQVGYYSELIEKNAHWNYVEGYIDEGLSAATTKNRENFHRMVEDGKRGLFDLIITKEITRFARNTLDSIRYTRELLQAGVGVFFQNDNINTLDEDSELRLTIMSGIAQDELRKLSSRVKFGHQQAIRNKVVLGNSRIFGYRKDRGRLLIEEEEAELVRELFTLYASGEYSLHRLEGLFWERGCRNRNGKRLSHSTLSGILSNPKYKGWYVGNKVRVVDLFTKKQKFLPPEEWVMFPDESGEIVPAIVDEALWERANEVLKRRSEDVKNRQGICNHANLLTGKLYCTHCNAPYYRRDSVDRAGHKNSKWVCSGKLKNGAGSCPSFAVYEDEIKPLLYEAFRAAEADTEALIEELLEMYRQQQRDGGSEKQLEALNRSIEVIQKKKQKLLAYNAMGELTDRDFLAMNRQCERELEQKRRELAACAEARERAGDGRKQTERLRAALREAQRDAAEGIITAEFIERYIDRIYAEPQGNGEMHLRIRVRTGEETAHIVQSRAGHMFKKMIEAYEEKLASQG